MGLLHSASWSRAWCPLPAAACEGRRDPSDAEPRSGSWAVLEGLWQSDKRSAARHKRFLNTVLDSNLAGRTIARSDNGPRLLQ